MLSKSRNQPDNNKSLLNIKWTSHLATEEEKKSFTEYVLASNGVTDRLVVLLREKVKEREVFAEGDFKNPSWAYMAADRNGYVRAIQEVIRLLEPINKQQ